MKKQSNILTRPKHRRIILIAATMAVLAIGHTYAHKIRIISTEDKEPLHYCTVIIPDIKWYGMSDDNGEVEFDFPADKTRTRVIIRSHDHTAQLIEISPSDTLSIVELRPRCDLRKVISTPLTISSAKKDTVTAADK